MIVIINLIFSDRSDFMEAETHKRTLANLLKHSETQRDGEDVMAFWLPDNKLPVRGE